MCNSVGKLHKTHRPHFRASARHFPQYCIPLIPPTNRSRPDFIPSQPQHAQSPSYHSSHLSLHMVVRIRLARWGHRNKPFYRIVAADSRCPRDGRHLDILGAYNPLYQSRAEAQHHIKRVLLNVDRIKYWLSHGAQPSETGIVFAFSFRFPTTPPPKISHKQTHLCFYIFNQSVCAMSFSRSVSNPNACNIFTSLASPAGAHDVYWPYFQSRGY